MRDKHGIEIKTGYVVKISNAYFKNDNGYYFVENSPGDPDWTGTAHCLKKICKNGRLSTAKHNICFWPISVFVNDPFKRSEAKKWNAEHAEIEVVIDVDRTEIMKRFDEKAESTDEIIRYEEMCGYDSDILSAHEEIKRHYKDVAAGIRLELALEAIAI